MTAVVLSLGIFLLTTAVLYGLASFAIRHADARYDRSSGETRRKNFR